MVKKCSFCGQEKESLIPGKDKGIYICHECLAKGNAYRNMEQTKKNIEKNLQMKPFEIVNKLNEYIIGQEEAKKTLAVEVCNHFKRINNISDTKIRKSNILMIGPTGSGKTALIERLAEILNIPIVIDDATSLTSAGYIGLNVENCLGRLYIESNKNLEKTQKGIVYIDEIDKVASTAGTNRDVGGEGVQQAFLKLMESTTAKVELSKDETIEIDTTNILFIFGGSFDGIVDIIKQRLNKKSIGIDSASIEDNMSDDEYLQKIIPQDLHNFGFINEFIGRVPVIVTLDKLTKNDLTKILLNTKDSLIEEYKTLFAIDDIQLEFTPDAIEYIADEAIKRNTGARGLRSIFSKQLNNLAYELPQKAVKKYKVSKKEFEQVEVKKE